MTYRVTPPSEPERVVLVAVSGPVANDDGVNWSEQTLLEELHALAISAGGEVVGQVVQRRQTPDKRFYIGRGKATELKDEVIASGAELVLFDNDLSPAQGKNLEDLVGVRVLDRSELILDIFADHARTNEAKLQVELAQLQYLLPRLRRMWTHLSRIRGGIGLRGPGETQLEVDRRVIRHRIGVLKEKLSHIEERRSLQRKSRRDAWNLALVGYTNVGKSTIMNRLSGERLKVEDKVFATLDATTRRIDLVNDEETLLTDTVGFIRNLPHHLVASFRATLEEVLHADLLLHVVDVSDRHYTDQMGVVRDVLADLGADDAPMIHVFNKFDRVPAGERASLRAHIMADYENGVMASAIEPRGLEALTDALTEFFKARKARVVVTLPLSDTRSLARLHELGEVLARRYTDSEVEVELETRPEVVARIEQSGLSVEEVE
jgi:GTP-binding protein HflX